MKKRALILVAAVLDIQAAITRSPSTDGGASCSARPCTFVVTCTSTVCSSSEFSSLSGLFASEVWRGDTVKLQAGRVFQSSAPLVFPYLSKGSGYVTITSTKDDRLPDGNTRITSSYAALLPEIRHTGSDTNILSAVEFEAGPTPARGYRFVGVKFGISSNIRNHARGLVRIGVGGTRNAFLADAASDYLVPLFNTPYHKLFLRFDHHQGIAPFRDYTQYGRQIAAYGGAAISQLQTRFGSASLSLNGAGQYVAAENSADFDFGSGAWGIDLWVWPNATSGDRPLVSHGSDGQNYWKLTIDNGIPKFTLKQDDQVVLSLESPTAVTSGSWWHIAVGKDTDLSGGPHWRLYVRRSGSAGPVATTVSSVAVKRFNGPLAIGSDAPAGGQNYFSGYIDEVLVVKDDCLYVASGGGAHTPVPSSAYVSDFGRLDWLQYAYVDSEQRLPSPLLSTKRYWFKAPMTNGAPSIQLFQDAAGSNRVDITDSGEGLHTIYEQGIKDGTNLPGEIIFDRCLFLSEPVQKMRKLLRLDSGEVSVLNSRMDAGHDATDAQAISGVNATGPFRFINNWLEGTGENVLFGGSAPGFDTEPTGVEIRFNYFPASPERFRWRRWSTGDFVVRGTIVSSTNSADTRTYVAQNSGITKDPEPVWPIGAATVVTGADGIAWKCFSTDGAACDSSANGASNQHWLVKNRFELKTGRNVTVEHNVFDYMWADGQTKAVNLKASNQPSVPRDCFARLAFPQCYTAKTKDVLFRNNIVRNIYSAFAIGETGGNNGGAGEIGPVEISNNLWLTDRDAWKAISGSAIGGEYHLYWGGADAWTFSNNTLYDTTRSATPYGLVQVAGAVSPRHNNVFTGNILQRGVYGIRASPYAEGNASAQAMWCGGSPCPPSQFGYNVVVGNSAAGLYPSSTSWVANNDAIGFIDPIREDFRLRRSPPASSFVAAGSHGREPGVNMAELPQIRNLSVTPTHQAALFAWELTAPIRQVPCVLEASTSRDLSTPVPDLDPVLFVRPDTDRHDDSPLGETTRMIRLGKNAPLQPGTQYYFRLQCGGDVKTGSFKTPAAVTGQTSVRITRTPVNPEAHRMSVEYGTVYTRTGDQITGSAVVDAPCSAGVPASLSFPATRGVVYYYRWKEHDGDGQVIYAGPVQAIAVQ